jgi:hypothetical protein
MARSTIMADEVLPSEGTPSPRKAPTRKSSKSKPEDGGAGQKPEPKTAVVVIHGMGEPRPLQTITAFVDTVYCQDQSLGRRGAAGPLNISISPDSATGSAELRRITTHAADGPQKRTDFYEFYWADIMDGTPVEMVTAWIQMLLLRAPWRVPKSVRVFSAWLILWALFLIVVTAGFLTVYPDLAEVDFIKSMKAAFGEMTRFWTGMAFIAIGAAVLLISFVLALLHPDRDVRRVKLGVPLVLIGIGLLVRFLPAVIIEEPRVWAAAITAVVGWFMNVLVAPYLGDVVRYVRATPSTVERRMMVRDRGIELLEALHAKRLDDEDMWRHTQADANDQPYYDRIVIVGHSLGSIVAYDLLQLFWERHGPTHHEDWPASNTKVQQALADVDQFVKQQWGKPQVQPFAKAKFFAAQATLQDMLRIEKPHWRISDLITLGSPLAHSEFLLADSVAEMERAFDERRFATSPPHPDKARGPTMLYPGKGDSTLYPHFAAQFAVVKWTNIHDHSHNPLLGDLISGALGWLFGPGIEEHEVAIMRPKRPWIIRRIFTHTQYWSWDESYVAGAEDVANAGAPGLTLEERRKILWAKVPEHVRQLRLALRLGT